MHAHISTADAFEEIDIEPTYIRWNWNASQSFPDLAPTKFSQGGADIADLLIFNTNEPIPWFIAQVFDNPMHYVTFIINHFIINYCLFLMSKTNSQTTQS